MNITKGKATGNHVTPPSLISARKQRHWLVTFDGLANYIYTIGDTESDAKYNACCDFDLLPEDVTGLEAKEIKNPMSASRLVKESK